MESGDGSNCGGNGSDSYPCDGGKGGCVLIEVAAIVVEAITAIETVS